MVWYKNIRVKKVTQSSKALNDNLFLLQDVNNPHSIKLHFIPKTFIFRHYDLLY